MAVSVSGIIPAGTIQAEAAETEIVTAEMTGAETATAEMTEAETATAETTTTAMGMIPDLNRDSMQDRSAAGKIVAVNRKHDR